MLTTACTQHECAAKQFASNIHVTTSQSEKWNIAWTLEVTLIFPMTFFPPKNNHYPDS